MKIELHTHPLVHRYYSVDCNNIELDSLDRTRIRTMINWAMSLGVEVLCPCDHNCIKSSIWAKEYVNKFNLPIKIVVGTEVSAYDHDYHEEVHIGAYGIDKLPTLFMPIEDTVKEIHNQGGIAILNHPMRINDTLSERLVVSNIFDGIEVYNHCNEIIGLQVGIEGMGTFHSCNPRLKMLRGSDNHNNYAYYNIYPYVPGDIDKEWIMSTNILRE